ncbi:hypothetical protein D3C72_2262910 [compost metagenome]
MLTLLTSRALWIWSPMATSTPLLAADGSAASSTALYKLIGPSADRAVDGRMAPTSTTGLRLLTTRFRK